MRLLDNTGKAYPFTGKERCGSHILPRRSYVEKYIWTSPVGLYYIWKHWGDSNLRRGGFSKAIESSERVRCRPARSSTNICQRGATSQRPGGCHASRRVGTQPEWAGHALSLVSQGNGIHYPVGHPLLGDSLSLLLASVTDKELV